MATYSIVAARPQDVGALAAIERAAGRLFEGLVPASIIDDSTDPEEFRVAQEAGHLWVALDGDTPVGFALLEVLSPRQAHLEEIDVDPQHGRRGLGAALVQAVCEWAARSGYAEVTLTTFRRIAWNMPFYARLGFAEVAAADWTPELEAVVRDETARGLDPSQRVVMSYRLSG